jgi:hypothetical protein
VAELVIDPRFNGPAGSANGGYTCGLLARLLDERDAEVTLRLPPPLGRPLRLEREDGAIVAFDGDARVAEARAVELRLEIPQPPSLEEAEQAAARYAGFEEHAFPTCFVCGPERKPGEGLRIFAGPLRDGVVASSWVPHPSLFPDGRVAPEFVWAALDCPGAFAVGFSARGGAVLGRFAARVDDVPAVGERCVVTAWPLGEEGRKLFAGTALYGEDRRVLGRARATWIVPLPL